jgi:hypothetical protein
VALNSGLTLKVTVFFAGTLIFSNVRGFTAVRALRSLWGKEESEKDKNKTTQSPPKAAFSFLFSFFLCGLHDV